MKRVAPTADNVGGVEGTGWRTALETESTNALDAAVNLAAKGWSVIDFDGLLAAPPLEGYGDASVDREGLASPPAPASSSTVPSLSGTGACDSALSFGGVALRVWCSPRGDWFGRWPDVLRELERGAAWDTQIDNVLAQRHVEAEKGSQGSAVATTASSYSSSSSSSSSTTTSGCPALSDSERLEGARQRFLRDGLWVCDDCATGAEGLSEEEVEKVAEEALDFYEAVLHTVNMRSLQDDLEVRKKRGTHTRTFP